MSQICLLDRLRNAIRVRQYSMATEKANLGWARRYILFHDKRHPSEMGKCEIESFLTHLAVNRLVAPSTQNQALQALLFLYKNVLDTDMAWTDDVVRAKPTRRVPVVLSQEEVPRLLSKMPPAQLLPASLMYGSGTRVSECIRLRVGDLDFSRNSIRIHSGKGGKDRVTILPGNLKNLLSAQIRWIKSRHDRDLAMNLGHKDIKTTMIYTHVVERGAFGAISPFDSIRLSI